MYDGVARLNNIRVCATVITSKDIIFVCFHDGKEKSLSLLFCTNRKNLRILLKSKRNLVDFFSISSIIKLGMVPDVRERGAS